MKIAFYKGRQRFFNRFVSWWTGGPYSHCEAVVDGRKKNNGPAKYCASSSFMDGGVRFKSIDLHPERWDILDLPMVDKRMCRNWFSQHHGEGYDWRALFSTSSPIRHRINRWMCSEAVGASVGLKESWRFNPNTLARALEMQHGAKWIQRLPQEVANTESISPVKDFLKV